LNSKSAGSILLLHYPKTSHGYVCCSTGCVREDLKAAAFTTA
jgi:hypothetical protein